MQYLYIYLFSVHAEAIFTADALPTNTTSLPWFVHATSCPINVTTGSKVADSKRHVPLRLFVVHIPTPYQVSLRPDYLAVMSSPVLHADKTE